MSFAKYRGIAKDIITIGTACIAILVFVDNRYLNKELSDIRETESKLEYLTREAQEYDRFVDRGNTLNSAEARDYMLINKRLARLLIRKNKLLGLDDEDK